MERSVAGCAAFTERADFVYWDQLLYATRAGAGLLAVANRVVLQVVEDRRGLELGRHVAGILTVLEQSQALRAHGARLRERTRDLGEDSH